MFVVILAYLFLKLLKSIKCQIYLSYGFSQFGNFKSIHSAYKIYSQLVKHYIK